MSQRSRVGPFSPKKEECSPYKAVEIKKIGKWMHKWGRRLNQLEFFEMKEGSVNWINDLLNGDRIII